MLVRALLAGALATAAPATALSPTLSLAELERWFETTQRSHELDLGIPHTWAYSFVAPDTRALEALWAELSRDDYRIGTLVGGTAPALHVTRVELHSPRTLVQRNQTLQRLARTHGARYASFGIAQAD